MCKHRHVTTACCLALPTQDVIQGRRLSRSKHTRRHHNVVRPHSSPRRFIFPIPTDVRPPPTFSSLNTTRYSLAGLADIVYEVLLATHVQADDRGKRKRAGESCLLACTDCGETDALSTDRLLAKQLLTSFGACYCSTNKNNFLPKAAVDMTVHVMSPAIALLCCWTVPLATVCSGKSRYLINTRLAPYISQGVC